jgi:hypothetical protein
MTFKESDTQRNQDVISHFVKQQDSEEPEVSFFAVFNNLFIYCLFKAAGSITAYIA